MECFGGLKYYVSFLFDFQRQRHWRRHQQGAPRVRGRLQARGASHPQRLRHPHPPLHLLHPAGRLRQPHHPHRHHEQDQDAHRSQHLHRHPLQLRPRPLPRRHASHAVGRAQVRDDEIEEENGGCKTLLGAFQQN